MYGGHFQRTLRTLVNWLRRDLLRQSAIFIKMYEQVPMYGGHFQRTLHTLVNWLPRDLLQQSAHAVCISGGARGGANSSPILMCIGLRSAQVG